MHGTSYLQLIGPMKMPSFGLSHMTYLVIPHVAKKEKKKKKKNSENNTVIVI